MNRDSNVIFPAFGNYWVGLGWGHINGVGLDKIMTHGPNGTTAITWHDILQLSINLP